MRLVAPFTLLLTAILLSGCLTVETKEYRITLKSDHSGEAVIKFVNILSEADDTLISRTMISNNSPSSTFKGHNWRMKTRASGT